MDTKQIKFNENFQPTKTQSKGDLPKTVPQLNVRVKNQIHFSREPFCCDTEQQGIVNPWHYGWLLLQSKKLKQEEMRWELKAGARFYKQLSKPESEN